MLATLADPIVPIFAILGIGFLMYRLRVFDAEAARAINKFVFFVATPALLFSILSNASPEHFDSRLLFAYFFSQCLIYMVVATIAGKLLSRPLPEAVLLGMTASFVNHVFFVLPIAQRIYGPLAAQPIAGIILVDSAVVFCGTVLFIDHITRKKSSTLFALKNLLSNPFLFACVLGVLAWYARDFIPQGIFTYADFVGQSAAPVSLFALGVILAKNPVYPLGIGAWLVVCAKIFFHPVLFLLITSLFALGSDAGDITLLVAAGPCGAMPFVIALQYNINPVTIAKAIFLSTCLSLLSLAFLAA